MRDTRNKEKKLKNKTVRKGTVKSITLLGALVVAFLVMWGLMAPGIAMEHTPHCGMEEHTHSDDCYTKELTCKKEESEGHHHTEECYRTEKVLSCGQEENDEHTHTDDCYTEEKKLVCDKEEQDGHTHTEDCYTKELTCGKEEHTHTDACYSDPNADTETEKTWKKTFQDVKLGDDWGENVAAIAKTQIGYKESSQNYSVSKSKEHKGYTRYGAWEGDAYMDWDTSFVAFCMHYAKVPEKAVPVKTTCKKWIKALQKKDLYGKKDNGEYQTGDLVFFQKKGQETNRQVGIIEKVYEKNGASWISVMEGNCDDQVRKNEYAADDADILGYGLISKAQEKEKSEQTSEQSDQEEEKKTEEKNTTEENKAIEEQNIAAEENTTEENKVVFFSNADGGQADVRTQSLETVDITEDPNTNVTIDKKTASIGDLITGKVEFRLDLSKVDIDENTIIEYSLPEGMKFTEEITGEMVGNVTGTYTLTKDGKIQIRISEESLEKYKDGVLTGGLSFKATIAEYPETGEIAFPGCKKRYACPKERWTEECRRHMALHHSGEHRFRDSGYGDDTGCCHIK